MALSDAACAMRAADSISVRMKALNASGVMGMGSLPMGIPAEFECIVEVGPAKKKPAPKAKKKAKARRR